MIRNNTTAPGRSGFKSWFRFTLIENPMFDEARREQRRFLRFGPVVRYVILFFFGLLYLWLGIESYIGHADATVPFSYIELVILTLLLPSSIHGSISGERERATWDALMLTRLTAAQIIFGKLVWRFRIILIVAILSIIPIIISRTNPDSFEISTGMFISAEVMILAWGLLLCTFGLWISAITKRSITSLAVIAGSLTGVLLLLPVLYSMFYSIMDSDRSSQNDFIFKLMFTFNPFTSLEIVLDPRDANNSAIISGGQMGSEQTLLYLALSIVFTIFTFLRIKSLEKPITGVQ